VLAALAVGVIIWVALAQNQTGKLDLGMFASYLVALLTLLDRLKSLSGINAAIQRGLAAAESIFGLLDREEEPDTGTVALPRARGELKFDRVALRYPGTEREALADVSLTIRPGETVALVGSSGSGKTSLVNLIPRFYEPTAGRLFIDGHDVTTLTLAFGMVKSPIVISLISPDPRCSMRPSPASSTNRVPEILTPAWLAIVLSTVVMAAPVSTIIRVGSPLSTAGTSR